MQRYSGGKLVYHSCTNSKEVIQFQFLFHSWFSFLTPVPAFVLVRVSCRKFSKMALCTGWWWIVVSNKNIHQLKCIWFIQPHHLRWWSRIEVKVYAIGVCNSDNLMISMDIARYIFKILLWNEELSYNNDSYFLRSIQNSSFSKCVSFPESNDLNKCLTVRRPFRNNICITNHLAML